jgi:methyl-accepting chemotaxis protein
MTQQNAAMVEQTTAAAHSLARQSTDLTELVAAFRLDDRSGSAGGAQSGGYGTPVRRAA